MGTYFPKYNSHEHLQLIADSSLISIMSYYYYITPHKTLLHLYTNPHIFRTRTMKVLVITKFSGSLVVENEGLPNKMGLSRKYHSSLVGAGLDDTLQDS